MKILTNINMVEIIMRVQPVIFRIFVKSSVIHLFCSLSLALSRSISPTLPKTTIKKARAQKIHRLLSCHKYLMTKSLPTIIGAGRKTINQNKADSVCKVIFDLSSAFR